MKKIIFSLAVALLLAGSEARGQRNLHRLNRLAKQDDTTNGETADATNDAIDTQTEQTEDAGFDAADDAIDQSQSATDDGTYIPSLISL